MAEQGNNQDSVFKTIQSFIADQTRVADDLIGTRYNQNGTIRVTIASENKNPDAIMAIGKKLGAVNCEYSEPHGEIFLNFNEKEIMKQAVETVSPSIKTVTAQEKNTPCIATVFP